MQFFFQFNLSCLFKHIQTNQFVSSLCRLGAKRPTASKLGAVMIAFCLRYISTKIAILTFLCVNHKQQKWRLNKDVCKQGLFKTRTFNVSINQNIVQENSF